MQENELNKILEELYRFEPSLRGHEQALRLLILQMSDIRPDTRFTPDLAAKLKEEVMRTIAVQANNKKISFNIMDKKIFYFAAPALIVGLAAVMILLNPGKGGKQEGMGLLSNFRPAASDEGVSRLAANAFGALNQNLANNQNKESGNVSAPEVAREAKVFGSEAATPVLGMGGDIAVSSKTVAAVGFGGGGVAMDSKMIAPWFNFKYVYKGEPLSLSEGTADVYRRLKGGSNAARSLAQMVENFDFGGLKLNRYKDLSATNLTLAEDKDKGLMISFDFLEDNVYISENWQRWRIPERDACTDDACWQRFRLDVNDVPADDALIGMANSFVSDHEIDLNHYGTPVVDNAWRQGYDLATDKANFYIPEYASVVYPLLVNDEPVLDQSGNYYGLRVSINLLQSQVSGLSGLTPYRYEASAYNLETSSERILKVAENGGWNRNYYNGSENVKEVELGTPIRSYVQLYRYLDGRNEELLVPALVFPVNNPDVLGYYGQRSVIVPLTQDLLGELEQDPNNGGPVIMMREGGAADTVPAATGATEAVEILKR
ncbi:MAG: hypothetical protein ACM3PZ_01835 [Bacillota bacterium]